LIQELTFARDDASARKLGDPTPSRRKNHIRLPLEIQAPRRCDSEVKEFAISRHLHLGVRPIDPPPRDQ
jgi:hypothetical protein